MAKKPAWWLINCIVLLGIALAACMPGAELTPTAATLPLATSTIASPSPACTAIGQIWTAPGDGMTLVCVPAGPFTMGSEEAGAYDDQKPVRVVTLAAYWIDRSEVTNAQYAACVSAGACSVPQETKSATRSSYYGSAQFKDYPVIYVDWDMAGAYCRWAGRRLPSEAEWEKAARGTDQRKYPWGSQEPASNLANFSSMAGDTTPVGAYPGGASPYGALDMAGNVWEWVNDWYAPYLGGAVSNPTGPSAGDSHVIRGASWTMNPEFLSSTMRGWVEPGHTYDYLGFRCAR